MSVKVSIINIGNELLLGQTINTNLSWLGTELAAIGLPVSRSATIQDDADAIKAALHQEWQSNDVVIMTGGLGPTKDDITKQVIADFFVKKLEFRADIWEKVQSVFALRDLPTPEINRSQAMVPEGFETYPNARGTAPGLAYSELGKLFFAFPGVPIEMKYLFNEYLRNVLHKSFPTEPIILRTIHTWKTSESALAERLEDIEIPEGINLAWLPQTGRVDLRIYGRNELKIIQLFDKIRTKIAENIWGYDGDTPASVLHDLLTEKKLTLSAAESCTGGLVSKLITDIPGASSYFLGSIVSYSNSIKSEVLGVSEKILNTFGAVSNETACEMATGILAKTKSDIGIAVTGIAGPEGGSKEKPVGTVYFAVASATKIENAKAIFNGDRNTVRHKAAEYVILTTIEYIRRVL
jgi:nicotinamide-nucleotide amidase